MSGLPPTITLARCPILGINFDGGGASATPETDHDRRRRGCAGHLECCTLPIAFMSQPGKGRSLASWPTQYLWKL